MRQLEQAEKLVESIKCPNSIIYTILMKAYVQSRNFEKAKLLLEKMEKNPDIAPVIVTYNTFLTCAFKTNNYEVA